MYICLDTFYPGSTNINGALHLRMFQVRNSNDVADFFYKSSNNLK